jgi:isocitrate dehydrogenase (NAD+)
VVVDAVLIPGDDSGPELVAAARGVLDAAAAATGDAIGWVPAEAGAGTRARLGTALPAATLDAVRDLGAALKGPTTTASGSGHRSVNIRLRQALDLYVCARPARSLPGVPAVRPDVDLLVLRENTEDIYAGWETGPGEPGYVELVARLGLEPGGEVSLKAISWAGSLRIARYAFATAAAQGQLVTCAALPQVFPETDGLFLAAARAAAAEAPGVPYAETGLADVMTAVTRGELRGVLLLQNLYGDIASDVAAATVGGLGVAPGANLGPDCAVFEATHGSAPAWAGRGVLNPTAMILSGAMMLAHLGLAEAAALVRDAVAGVLAEGTQVTSDLRPGGLEAGLGVPTEVFVEAVLARLDRPSRPVPGARDRDPPGAAPSLLRPAKQRSSEADHPTRPRPEVVIPALDWSTLTRSPLKARHYRDEICFREAMLDVREVLGEQAGPQLRRAATLMVKPDGLAAGKLAAVHDFLHDNGFTVAAVERPRLTGLTWRELWRYQLTAATCDRLAVYDLVLCRPALLLVLRHDDPGDLPATVRLSSLKGPADVADQRPGCLRALLGQPTKIFSYVHVADEPVDLVRELGIVLDREARARVLAALPDRTLADADRHVLAEALDEDRRVERDMDASAALERAAVALAVLSDGQRSTPAAGRLQADVDRMRAGQRIEWRPFARAVADVGVKLDEWDLALLGASFIAVDVPGEAKMIGSVRPDDWRSGTGPPGEPRAD